MALKEELTEAVTKILRELWSERDGQKVPGPEDLQLGNDAVKLDGTVLYADMTDSTKLVDSHIPQFAAEVYKSYLTCAAKIVKSEGGVITSYDGDRIMAVYIGDSKNTSAVRSAMKINYAVLSIINPAIRNQYPNTDFQLKHVVGVDTSSLYVARIGVRNDNDLVWVGRSANHAAKLCAIKEDNTTFISSDVFNNMNDQCKYDGQNKEFMWKERQWTQMNNIKIYSSSWRWVV